MRKSYINHVPVGTPVVLTNWIRARGMTQRRFSEFLTKRGLILSPETCSGLFAGKITPGYWFRTVFKEITGIALTCQSAEGGRQ